MPKIFNFNKTNLLFLLIIFLSSISLISSSTKKEARITVNAKNEWKIIYENFDETINYVATAYYTDSLSEIGWDKLSITTNSLFKDEIQAEAAGRLEGSLTKERIYYHHLNLKDDFTINENISKFFEDQEKFVNDSVLYGEGKNDPMLYNAYLIKIQYNAIITQYNIEMGAEMQLQKNDFHILNYVAEIGDIYTKFRLEKEGPKDYTKMTEEEIIKIFLERNHCSALFKIKNDLSDIYFGHNTWNTYYSAIRIIKEYNLNYNNRWVKSKNIIFTSYPATMSSLDDFYISSHGLIAIETTNSIYNDTLFDKVTTDSLFTCERAMIANRISNSSKEWAENFGKYNSGTYNNQFMILDKNKVNLVNKSIEYDAFYIVETLPGLVKINNVTDILKFGYWSSFNVAYDKDIYELSGVIEMMENNKRYIPYVDYDNCARTKIFRRDHYKAENIDGFMELMRYNNYTKEPFAEKNPSLSISSRSDLTSSYCGGAYDSKVGALSEWTNKKVKFHLIGGPTYDNVEIKPFSWEDSSYYCKTHNHYLLPEIFKFDWIEYESEFPFDN